MSALPTSPVYAIKADIAACRFHGVYFVAQYHLHNWQSWVEKGKGHVKVGIWSTEEKAARAHDQATIARSCGSEQVNLSTGDCLTCKLSLQGYGR